MVWRKEKKLAKLLTTTVPLLTVLPLNSFMLYKSLIVPPDQIEDVTGKYGKEEELVTCGICELLDPPVDPAYPVPSTETTEWVGCDCYRLF